MVRRLLGVVLVLATSGCELRPASVAAAPRASVATCDPPLVASEGRCLSPEAAYTAPGGTAYVVDQYHPEADDDGPGSADRPWRTISRAARLGAMRPGDAVLIRTGVYRESIRPRVGGTGPRARVTYAAFPGDTVIVSGADVTTDRWRPLPDGRTWRIDWTGPPMRTYTEADHFRRELVVSNGDVLRPVYRREDLVPGSFWADGPPEAPVRLVARFQYDAPPAAARPVEVAYRTFLFSPKGEDEHVECGDASTPGWIRVVGLAFRHATNRAQWGAFCAGREGGLVEDVRVEWTNGLGIDVGGTGHTFLRTRSDLNGQLGWRGSCQNCLIDESTAIGNNWKGHSPFWEAGGGKWVRSTGTTIRRHLAAYNDGPGIWLDIDNHNNTIERSLVVGNEVAGIMLELRTTGTLVQHNAVIGTRQREWVGSGILTQAASGNLILHNTVVANGGTGVWLRLDPERRAPDIGSFVLNNRVVGNTRGADEARQIHLEATSGADLRTLRVDGNTYGRVEGDGVWRSAFRVWTANGDVDYRGDDLGTWRARTGADGRSDWSDGPAGQRAGLEAATGWAGGARGTSPSFTDEAGADRRRVRLRGSWLAAERPLSPPWFDVGGIIYR